MKLRKCTENIIDAMKIGQKKVNIKVVFQASNMIRNFLKKCIGSHCDT